MRHVLEGICRRKDLLRHGSRHSQRAGLSYETILAMYEHMIDLKLRHRRCVRDE